MLLPICMSESERDDHCKQGSKQIKFYIKGNNSRRYPYQPRDLGYLRSLIHFNAKVVKASEEKEGSLQVVIKRGK